MDAIRGAFLQAKRYANGGSDGDSYDPALDPAEDEAKAFADRAPVAVTPPPSTADRARAAASQLSAARLGTPPSPIPQNAPPGEQSLTQYTPTLKESILNTLSDSLAGQSLPKQNFVEGIGHIMDWVPGIGQALQAQEGIQHGDYQTAAAAFLPGAAEGFGGFAKTAEKQAAAKVAEELAAGSAYKTKAGTGSQPGGFFSGFSDGQDRYIKWMDKDHAQNEVLANRFYEMWGVPVAHNELTTMPNGQAAVASHIIPNAKHLNEIPEDTYSWVNHLHDHFPADAMLANWDVIGLNRDNVLVGQDGQAYRIDHGGALQYRAQGAPKGAKFGTTVGELDTMREKGEAGQVFHGQGLYPENETAQRIAATTDQQITDTVTGVMGKNQSAYDLASKMVARRDDLAKRYGISSDPHLNLMPQPMRDWHQAMQGAAEKYGFKHLPTSLVPESFDPSSAQYGMYSHRMYQNENGDILRMYPIRDGQTVYNFSLAKKGQPQQFSPDFASPQTLDKMMRGASEELTGGGEHPPGTFPRPRDDVPHEINPPENFGMPSPQQTAEKLLTSHSDDNGVDYHAIAHDMYDMAGNIHPSFVDEVYKALPHNIQADVNDALTQHIAETGVDPWSIHEAEHEPLTGLPPNIPKMAPTPADEKLTAGPPLKLMQLNKTHSPGQIVQSVSQISKASAEGNPKLVTPKQIIKIQQLVDKLSPSALASHMADLPYPQQVNIKSWMTNTDQYQKVNHAIESLKTGQTKYTAADLAEHEENQHQHALYEYEMQQGLPVEEQESSFLKKPVTGIDTKTGAEAKGQNIGGSFVPQYVFDAIKPFDATKYKVKNGKYLTQADFPNAKIEDVKKQGYGLLQLWHGQEKGQAPGGYFYQWQDPTKFKGYTYPSEAAIFLSHDPYIGQAYSKGAALPYVARMNGKVGIVHYPEAHYSDIEKHSKDYTGYSSTTNARLTKAGRAMGYDMLVVKGMSDSGGPQTQYMVLNPAILRAPTAKFDPAKKKLMESLSGIVGIPAAGAATYGISQQQQPQYNRGGSVKRAMRVVRGLCH